MAILTTLCYIENDEQYLMLHRTKKKNDLNEGKWIGVGGKFERDESPEECLLREVREETGYTLTSWRYRGIVTFISGRAESEYMHLFTADGFSGEQTECNEGELKWIAKKDVPTLNVWPGDRIFLKLLLERQDFFSLKLVYDAEDRLLEAKLDGKDYLIEN
ncbi:NUDIX hydrolase [Oribacterium sp. P6A1]|uniref:NUDIX hydrolase n=1 Tax=Oribacterium sp. P6A1 TaxID=1410612 RepID=UPI00055F8F90|nr:8-oxo-dGTP diphosphatase [Oribacterium sp. P6A1]